MTLVGKGDLHLKTNLEISTQISSEKKKWFDFNMWRDWFYIYKLVVLIFV